MTFDPDQGKVGFARHLFRLRFRRLKLSQRAFAKRFGLGYTTIRDAEQGAAPTPALRLIVAMIDRDPDAVARAAILAKLPCYCGKLTHDRACGRVDTAER